MADDLGWSADRVRAPARRLRRRAPLARGERTFLALHRAHEGPDYEGDWAWTPPAGARSPGEPVDDCARRELTEETGLDLPIRRIRADDAEPWATYVAEAPADAEVVLDEEHDRFAWLPLEDLLDRCAPEEAADGVRRAAAAIADLDP